MCQESASHLLYTPHCLEAFIRRGFKDLLNEIRPYLISSILNQPFSKMENNFNSRVVFLPILKENIHIYFLSMHKPFSSSLGNCKNISKIFVNIASDVT